MGARFEIVVQDVGTSQPAPAPSSRSSPTPVASAPKSEDASSEQPPVSGSPRPKSEPTSKPTPERAIEQHLVGVAKQIGASIIGSPAMRSIETMWRLVAPLASRQQATESHPSSPSQPRAEASQSPHVSVLDSVWRTIRRRFGLDNEPPHSPTTTASSRQASPQTASRPASQPRPATAPVSNPAANDAATKAVDEFGEKVRSASEVIYASFTGKVAVAAIAVSRSLETLAKAATLGSAARHSESLISHAPAAVQRLGFSRRPGPSVPSVVEPSPPSAISRPSTTIRTESISSPNYNLPRLGYTPSSTSRTIAPPPPVASSASSSAVRSVAPVAAAGARSLAPVATRGATALVAPSAATAAGGAGAVAAIAPVASIAIPVVAAAAAVIGLASSAKQASDVMGPLGPVVVGVIGAINPLAGILAGPIMKKIQQFGDGIEREVHRLHGFNVQLSAAQARTEVRELRGTFRDARRLGPTLSNFEDTRSRLGESINANITEFKALMLKSLERFLPILNRSAEMIDIVTEFIEKNQASLLIIIQFLQRVIPGGELLDAIARIADLLEKDDLEDLDDPFMTDLLSNLRTGLLRPTDVIGGAGIPARPPRTRTRRGT